ncbi:pentapeptide repeat-containing protein [Desulfovibrio sp. JC010]|uniref:pentapeptide repeat-containing protein n=1 Tax=Desulfovibrio sp. JC010 TaxID=2593641 RepID=UPI0013CFC5FB|nr:pentapeptide repeat-containing protein [Desulfovibrio sp. JC010]NDV26571.1 pentapeptide repeat-containing protein [Desulfovibrio sp. JC010]
MGCCIGEKHSNWCKDYDIVYIDADGKEYCIFHAPADCKFDVPSGKPYDGRDGGERPALMRAEKFNGLIFERIDGVIEEGEDEERDKDNWLKMRWNPRCNFSATIFPYEISLSKYHKLNAKHIPPINLNYSFFLKHTDFKNAFFDAKSNFNNVHFKSTSDFRNTTFNKINFINTHFHNTPLFIDTHFCDETNFSDSQFYNEITFEHAQFIKNAIFKSANFNGKATFEYVHFMKTANFSKSIFLSETDFSNTKFHQQAKFINSKFNACTFFVYAEFQHVDFNETESLMEIYFDHSKFEKASFYLMEFNGPTFFQSSSFENKPSFDNTIFQAYSNFEQTIFEDGVNFNLAFFKEWTYFRDSKFLGETSFAGAISKETILLESVNLTNLKFDKTNIESFKFINCTWGDERFAPIYDEKHQEETDCTDTTLAEIYRRLKRIARESADEEQTSHWHYREKEMTRKSLDKAPSTHFWNILATAIFMIPVCAFFLKMQHEYFLNIAVGLSLLLTAIVIGYNDFQKIKNDINKVASKIYLNFYQQISGYGEDPIRAGAILFCLVIFPFLAQFIISLTPWANQDWLKMAMWYMPLIKIKFADTDLTGLQYFFKGISVTLITLQAALFGFALRNKLRR